MMVGQLANVVLMPRTGPRPLIAAGMLLGGTSAALLTRLGPHSSYAGYILPSVLLIGAGLGFIFAPSADTCTARSAAGHRRRLGHRQHRQPARRSIGTSLPNSIFATAIATWIAANVRGRPTRRARPGRAARLYRRVPVDRRDLRRRRGHLRRPAALRAADPPRPARPARRPPPGTPGRGASLADHRGAGPRARAPQPGTGTGAGNRALRTPVRGWAA